MAFIDFCVTDFAAASQIHYHAWHLMHYLQQERTRTLGGITTSLLVRLKLTGGGFKIWLRRCDFVDIMTLNTELPQYVSELTWNHFEKLPSRELCASAMG